MVVRLTVNQDVVGSRPTYAANFQRVLFSALSSPLISSSNIRQQEKLNQLVRGKKLDLSRLVMQVKALLISKPNVFMGR